MKKELSAKTKKKDKGKKQIKTNQWKISRLI